jgi:dsRNA-specific ribonuclease
MQTGPSTIEKILAPGEKHMAANKRWSDKKFKKFLTAALKRANVNDEHIKLFLSKENLKEFKIAFTHPSLGEAQNYELYEFLGDVVINEFVAFYVRERFPQVVNVKWTTRLKHNLISKKDLAKIALKEGLGKFGRYGEDMEYLRLNPHLDERNEFLSMMEDFMEAFIGCLTTIIKKSGKTHGAATEICRLVLKGYYDQIPISLKYEDVFDAVTRLKELYERKATGLLWPNDQVYIFERRKEGNIPYHVAIVYGWPLGDRKARFRKNRQAMKSMGFECETDKFADIGRLTHNEWMKRHDPSKVMLSVQYGVSREDAKMKAAEEARKVLEKTYGIKDKYPEPYARKEYDPTRSKKYQMEHPELFEHPDFE